MFLGSYNNSIDSKGRAIVPAKFRHALGEKCILTKGVDKCLYIFTPEALTKYAEEHIMNRPDEDEEARNLKLSFFSSVIECEIDKQGRIKIPGEYLEYAEIKKEMTNVGVMEYIQVWSKDVHQKTISNPAMEQKVLMANMTKYVGEGGQK